MLTQFDIVILGLRPQGLFLLREFSKAGLRVLGIGYGGDVGRFSKYGFKVIIQKPDDLDNLFARYSRYLSDKTQIHITDDWFLSYLTEIKHPIFEKHTCFPNYECALLFRDKMMTKSLATSLNIPCLPLTKLSHIDESNIAHFPLVVKNNKLLHNTHREYSKTPFKIRILNSTSDLRKVKIEHGSNTNLIVQSYIPGGPEADLSYRAFYKSGKELFSHIVNPIRTFPEGVCCFGQEYHGVFEDEIRNNSLKLLAKTNFSGFVEVEYRVHKDTNKLLLLEVNPRTAASIKIIKPRIKDISVFASIQTNEIPETTIRWVNIVRDFQAMISILKNSRKQFNLKEILKQYLSRPITDAFEWSDPKPFFAQFPVYVFYQLSSLLRDISLYRGSAQENNNADRKTVLHHDS